MDNFYVLLGLNASFKYDENEIDSRVRRLTEAQIASLAKGRTLIRQMFAEQSYRNQMRSAFAEGTLFTAEYRKEDHKLFIFHKLPCCYGEFTVFASAERVAAGAHERDALMKICTEVGETEIGEDGMAFTVISPALSAKYYYPAVKLSASGSGKCYIVGCEENRAFVRNIKTNCSYETVTAVFDWGVFSRAFYILASEDRSGYSGGHTATLRSVLAEGEQGRAVGIIRGLTKFHNFFFVEVTDTGESLLLEESEI